MPIKFLVLGGGGIPPTPPPRTYLGRGKGQTVPAREGGPGSWFSRTVGGLGGGIPRAGSPLAEPGPLASPDFGQAQNPSSKPEPWFRFQPKPHSFRGRQGSMPPSRKTLQESGPEDPARGLGLKIELLSDPHKLYLNNYFRI